MLRSLTLLLSVVLLTGCCGHMREFPAHWTNIPPAERLAQVPDNVLAAAVRRFPGYGFNSAGATMVVCRGDRSYHLYAVAPAGKFAILTFDPDGNFIAQRVPKSPNDGTYTARGGN